MARPRDEEDDIYDPKDDDEELDGLQEINEDVDIYGLDDDEEDDDLIISDEEEEDEDDEDDDWETGEDAYRDHTR